jgi:hypothetical protein
MRPAELVFGAAVLCFGIAPRWTAGVGYGLVGWSFHGGRAELGA